MIPSWTLLGLGGVFLAVGGTLFDKYLLSKYFDTEDEKEAGPGALLIFSAYFSVCIIIGLTIYNFSHFVFTPIGTFYSILAGITNGLWILLYLHAINRTDVSKTAPILQTIPAFGLLLAFFTLGEILTAQQLVAIFVLVMGSLVLLHERGGGLLKVDTKTLYLMLSSAFLVAVSQVFFKLATGTMDYFSSTLVLWSGFLLFGCFLHGLVISYRKQFMFMLRGRVKNVLTLNSGNELFDSIGELLFFAAIVVGPIALVQSLNVYEPVLLFIFSIGFTVLFPKYFSEGLTKYDIVQKSIGILIVVIGSIILYQSL